MIFVASFDRKNNLNLVPLIPDLVIPFRSGIIGDTMASTNKINRNKEEAAQTSQSAIGLSYQLVAATILFAGSGYYLDSRRGGGYTFTLAGIALTFLYGGYEVWKLVRWMEKVDRDSNQTGLKNGRDNRDRE
jgi:hypothetical protein